MVKNLADLTRGGMLNPEHLRVVDVTRHGARGGRRASGIWPTAGQIKLDLQLPRRPVVMTTNAVHAGQDHRQPGQQRRALQPQGRQGDGDAWRTRTTR